MTAIPFGIVGAVIGHILLGYDLSLGKFNGGDCIVGRSGKRLADYDRLCEQTQKRRRPYLPIDP